MKQKPENNESYSNNNITKTSNGDIIFKPTEEQKLNIFQEVYDRFSKK